MNYTLTDRGRLGLFGVLAPPMAFLVLWLNAANSGQLQYVSRWVFLAAAGGALFLTGVAVGRFWPRSRVEDTPRGGWGGGGGGPRWPVPEPGPDPIELELQRLIDDERSKLD